MQYNRAGWLHPPAVGQRFTDEAGKHWHVKAVIRSPGLDGYYIVRVCFGSTLECADGVSLLGRGEFGVLCREKKLRASTPEAVKPSCEAECPGPAPAASTAPVSA